MGIKLLVDDLRQPVDDSWVVARTVTQAIRLLDTTSVDEVELVVLDHDIFHTYPDDATIAKPFLCPETFEPVARYIAMMPKPPRVTFVTSNPAGCLAMERILADGERRRAEAKAELDAAFVLAHKTRHALQRFTQLCAERHVDKPQP